MENKIIMYKTIYIPLITFCIYGQIAYSDCYSQAKNMFQNLTGTIPPRGVLQIMESHACSGNFVDAALVAMDFKDRFYRKFRADWNYLTNEARLDRGGLNSATALMICLIRDEVPFNEILFGDHICHGKAKEGDSPLPDPTLTDNIHFDTFESAGLSYKENLFLARQTEQPYYQANGFSKDSISGILTTQQWGQQYFLDGTNRAVLAFTFDAFLCKEIEELSDNTLPKNVIMGAVERAPGGVPETFVNKCSACHSVLDAALGATAFHDYTAERGFVFNPTRKTPENNLPQVHQDWFNSLPENAKDVNEKINRNGHLSASDFGRIMVDDSWSNSLSTPKSKHASLGWNGIQKGKGLPAYGKMLSMSDQFSLCMAQRAYASTCGVKSEQLTLPIHNANIKQLSSRFSAEGRYNMKHLFAYAAVTCRGE